MLKAPHALKPWPEVAYPLHQLKHGNKQEPSHSWNNNIGDRHPPGKFTTTIQTGTNNHAPEPRPRVHQNGIVIMQNGGNTQVYGNNNHFYSPRTRRLLRDPYLRNKAKFESRPKLPPILEDASSQDSDHESTASGTFRKNINKKNGRQLKSRSPRSNPSNPPINARRPTRDPPRHINSDQWFVPNGYHVDDTTIVIDTDGVESLGPLPTSRTRVNLHRNSNKKKKRRLWICVSVIATFLVLGLAASGVAIYLAARAILNEDSTTDEPPTLSLYSIYMRVKLTGAVYKPALQEKTSPYYTSLQKDFCDLMKISNEAKIDLKKIYQECSVYKYSPGSVIVHAELRYDRDGSKAIESTTGKTIKKILHLTVIDILANNSRAKTFKNKYAPDTDSIFVSASKEEKSTTSPTTSALVVTSAPYIATSASTSDGVVTTLQSSSYSTSASSAAQTKIHTPIWHTTSAFLSTITTGHIKTKTSSPVTSDIGKILSSTLSSVMVSTVRTTTAGQTQVVTSQTSERFTPTETDSVPSTTESTTKTSNTESATKISTAVSTTEASTAVSPTEASTVVSTNETSTAVSTKETSATVSTTETSTATPKTSGAPASEGTTIPHVPGVPVTADGTASAATSTIKLSPRPLSTSARSTTTRATVKASIPSLTTYSSSITKDETGGSRSVTYASPTSTINRAPTVTTSMPVLSEATANSTTVLTTATSEKSVTISRETSNVAPRMTATPPVSSEGNYKTVTETSPPSGHDVTTATIPSTATFDTTSSPQVVSMRLPAFTADNLVTTNVNQTDRKPGASPTVLPSGNVSDTTTDWSSQGSNITGAESAATVSPGTGESRSDTPAMGNVNETDHATEPARNVTEASPPAVGTTTSEVTPAGHTENYPGRTRDDGAFVTTNVTSIIQNHTTTAFITTAITQNKTVAQHTTSSGVLTTENLDSSALSEGINVNEINQSTTATTVGFISTEHSNNYTANTANPATMSSGLTPLTSGSTTSEPTAASSIYSTTRTLTDGRTIKSVFDNTTAAVSETVTKELQNIATSHDSSVGEKTKASADTLAKTEAGSPASAAKSGGTTAAMGRTSKAAPHVPNDETTPVLQDVTETEGSGQPVTP